MLETRRDLLVIFVKNPEEGKVKTRLAADIGNKRALDVYQKLLAYTRGVVQKLNVTKEVWYSSHVDNSDDWGADQFIKKLQKGDNLGERMQEAFRQGFLEGFGRILIIGSDCPALSDQHLLSAYEELECNDVVLGPSQDGGYYLLGMNHYIPELFINKSWSRDSLYGETIKTLDQLDESWGELEELNDIDTLDDLNKSSFEIGQS